MLTWNFFYHYLFAKRAGSLIKTITRICVFGIGIGMAALIIVMSVMTGFNINIKNRILLTKPHIAIQGDDFKTYEQLIRQLDPSSEQYVVENQDVVVRTIEGVFSGAIAKGMAEQPLKHFFARLVEKDVGDNGTLEQLQSAAELKENEVILGLGLARSLDVFEGDELVIIPPESLLSPSGELPVYSKVRVKSIIHTQLSDIDNKVMYYGLGKSLKSLGQSRSMDKELEVRLSNIGMLAEISTILKQAGAKFETWEDRDASLLFALKMEKLMIAIFIGLATLITSFSIITVLILLITQKRRDIGILMAMGLSQKDTRRLFTKIGLMLSCVGLGGGFLVGVLVSLFLSRADLKFLPDIYQDTSIPVTIDANLLLGALIGGIVVALLGSLLPVLMSLRYTPVQAIRGAR